MINNNIDKIITLAKEDFGGFLSIKDEISIRSIFVRPDGNEESISVSSNIVKWLATCPNLTPLIHSNCIKFENSKIDEKLDLENANILYALELKKCSIPKGICLKRAKTRNLNFSGSFIGGIDAREIEVNGSVFLNEGFSASGLVTFLYARITGEICGKNARFENPDGEALNIEGARVDGQVRMQSSYFFGRVNLKSIRIGWGFFASESTFINPKSECNPKSIALFLSGICTENGSIYLDSINVKGAIALHKARISFNLNFDNSKLSNPNGYVLKLGGITVEGSVYLKNNFIAEGEVEFVNARIKRDLDCRNASFINPKGIALNLERAQITGGLLLSEQNEQLSGILNLHQTSVGYFNDDKTSWPKKGELILDGFTYSDLDDDTPSKNISRLEWLLLGTKEKFAIQPYEQLAQIYRKQGKRKDADNISRAKLKDLRKYGNLGFLGKIGNWLLDITCGYGYQSGRSLKWCALFLIIGIIFFGYADIKGDMFPSKIRMYQAINPSDVLAYPRFNAFVYSIDVFVPFVDLHQEASWEPKSNTAFGFLTQIYLWFHIFFGWIFSTLTAISISGIIRKD